MAPLRHYFSSPDAGEDADGKQPIDTTTLASDVSQAFDLSLDGRFSLGQRGAFNALGHRLRDQLSILLAKLFDAETEAYKTASEEIVAVDAKLAETKADITQAADCIESLGRLAASLDTLLHTLATF
jgi:phage tail tape-measure protein